MRSYTIQSGKYISKNFFYLLPFALLPAFFLSLCLAKEDLIFVTQALISGNIKDLRFVPLFSAISVLNFASWESVIVGIIAIVLLIACTAMLMALLEKHMRIGKRSFRGLFSKLNDNLIPTLVYACVVLVIYEVWSLVTAAGVLLMSKIPLVWLAYTLAAIIFAAAHVVLIYMLGFLYLWLPCMQITGFRAWEAFQYSYHLMAPVRYGILGVQTLLLCAVGGLTWIFAWFVADGLAFTVITTLLYVVLIMVYCVRMEIVYFDRENIERADYKRYY